MKLVKTFFIAWLMAMVCGGVCYAEAKPGDTFSKTTSAGTTFYYVITDTTSAHRTVEVVKHNDYTNLSGSITIPDTVKTSVSPDTTYYVTTIEEKAFRLCTNLTSVTLPNSIDTIKTEAFRGCGSLTGVTINGTPSLRIIGDSAFYSCNNLTNFTIPNTVTKIGVRTFINCAKLEQITIPGSVVFIDQYAFWGCTGIKKIKVNWTSFNGVTVNSNAVNKISNQIDTIKLIVPESALSIYTSTSPWNEFLIPQRTVTADEAGNIPISTISLRPQATADSFYL
ncbi:MAG: leucine-rich repeat domain-containing protein, partial [Tannerella sp.]|nr:leucine-rich repeat domain-containing protein [Tannerella sp.]